MKYPEEFSWFNHNRIACPVLLCMLGVVFFSCSPPDGQTHALPLRPVAHAGRIELCAWDFKTDGCVRLDGEWEMYWQQLYDPVQFKELPVVQHVAPLYVPVPANWTTYRSDGKKLPCSGFDTFHLKVRLKKTLEQKAETNGIAKSVYNTELGIKLLEMYTAYRLYINGRLTAGNGVVGEDAQAMYPQFLPQVVAVQPENAELDILIQVSNFCFSKGGICRSLLLGNYKTLLQMHENNKAYNFFFSGAILMIGLYHLGLFWLGRKEKGLLFFGFFCLLIMFRNFFIGERVVYEIVPAFNWALGLKLELLPIFIGPVFFLLFIKSLYPYEINKRLLLVFTALNCTATLVLGIIPTLYIDFIFYINTGLLTSVCIYISYALSKAAFLKRPGAKILTAGFFIFFASIINDILYVEGIFETNHYLSLGLVFFILAEVAINEKFVRAEEQLKIEHEKLVHADKLAALGTLVASVAHEVNNPNNVIKINISSAVEDAKNLRTLIAENIAAKEDLRIGMQSYTEFIDNFDASLNAISKSAEEIRQIVEDLKTYAKHKKDEPAGLLDFNQLVRDVIRLMAPFIRSATNRFIVTLAADLPPFFGQSQRLKQVLVNLLQNACQALENRQQGIYLSTAYRPDSGCLELLLQDEGVGMDKETRQRLFEPFFTKKQTEGGTGLGLSISRQIVIAHNGELTFDTRPGKGTTVCLTFRIMDRED